MAAPRVTAREANRNNTPCPQGHTNHWKITVDKRKTNPTRHCAQCARDKARAHTYGLSPQAYAQLRAKHPVCAICGEDGTDHGMGSLEIDHDHNTNEIRGLLCRRCNIFLGHYESRKHLLPAVEKYLWQGS